MSRKQSTLLPTETVNNEKARNAVPQALQALVTQTDKDGNALPIAAPQYAVESKSVSQKGMLQRFLTCCLQSISYGIYDKDIDMKPLPGTGKIRTESASSLSTVSTGVDDDTPRSSEDPNRAKPIVMPKLIRPARYSGKKCLVLDLDETLVHSSFQPVKQASFAIPVSIEGVAHRVYVIKRPGVDEFLKSLSEHYELVVYTASLAKYADPLLDKLDPFNYITHRLFRESCVFHEGHFVKDLDLLNRELSQTIIIDNSPNSYIFHNDNAIGCTSFIDDPSDVEMWELCDFLKSHKDHEDVRRVCGNWKSWVKKNSTSAPKYRRPASLALM
jgi:RNA polymerase II subunit A small phosphatase-like protein